MTRVEWRTSRQEAIYGIPSWRNDHRLAKVQKSCPPSLPETTPPRLPPQTHMQLRKGVSQRNQVQSQKNKAIIFAQLCARTVRVMASAWSLMDTVYKLQIMETNKEHSLLISSAPIWVYRLPLLYLKKKYVCFSNIYSLTYKYMLLVKKFKYHQGE